MNQPAPPQAIAKREALARLAAMAAGVGLGVGVGIGVAPAQELQAAPAARGSAKRIAVVGAGLAGLAAARQLQQQGHEVVVIEARERIGGRIWTSNQWPDMPVDLGASWIHGVRGNPLTELADQLQAKRWITQYDKAITYTASGAPLSQAEEARLEALGQQVMAILKKAQDGQSDSSIRQALAPLMAQYRPNSVEQHWINFIVSGQIETEYAGSATALSVQWYDSAQDFAGDDALFAQGFAVIANFLARDLHIELGQVVEQIDWQQTPVRIRTQKTQFLADHVVVTLPLGVLQAQRVAFLPELPAAKKEAIAELGMGLLNKCYLRFPTAFWPDDVDWLEYIPERHGQWTQWVSYQHVAKQPVLLGFHAADRAKEIEAWSDQETLASAMQTLRTIFGQGIPQPIGYQITRWASDPFALGSYSCNLVGATPAMRGVLAAPLQNKLFFAGEASQRDYFGTAHGAYLSGVRAAKEVLAL